MTTPRKEKKRESRREEKAEKAAILDKVTYSCHCGKLFCISNNCLQTVDRNYYIFCRVLKKNCLNVLRKVFMAIYTIILSKNTIKFLIWKDCRLLVKMKRRRFVIISLFALSNY